MIAVKPTTVFEAIDESGHDYDFEPWIHSVQEGWSPTDAPAGTLEKVVVLRSRAEQGFPLWHGDDRVDYSGLTGAVLPTVPQEPSDDAELDASAPSDEKNSVSFCDSGSRSEFFGLAPCLDLPFFAPLSSVPVTHDTPDSGELKGILEQSEIQAEVESKEAESYSDAQEGALFSEVEAPVLVEAGLMALETSKGVSPSTGAANELGWEETLSREDLANPQGELGAEERIKDKDEAALQPVRESEESPNYQHDSSAMADFGANGQSTESAIEVDQQKRLEQVVLILRSLEEAVRGKAIYPQALEEFKREHAAILATVCT